ncbi:MAG: CGNR zinc finger domain-containing protein [Solirubrobacterales bacterium]|nr:CGNR zinc finger domain-containing protein [Solirubrobacterales bacterium]MBV9801490.1 CGNR zinc finger domain-containing protein [Solirubrobacterales bacterium]
MPVSSSPPRPPPHRLELVIDFINTLDMEEGTDELASVDGLARWLEAHELLRGRDAGAEVGEVDRRRAIGLREALRSLGAGHGGGLADPQAAGELEHVAERGQLSVRFGEDGSATFEPRESGFAGALAKLLVPIAEASRDGTWQRVKVCRSGDCQWAFYDHSRNRSGVWCDMAVCGNRTKVRAYRRRGAVDSDQIRTSA